MAARTAAGCQAGTGCGSVWPVLAQEPEPAMASQAPAPARVPACGSGLSGGSLLPPRSPPDQCNKLICAQARLVWPGVGGGGGERLVSVVTLAQNISAAGILIHAGAEMLVIQTFRAITDSRQSRQSQNSPSIAEAR